MFIAAPYLVDSYGVDEEIALFFVDRKPPAGNLYWHEKLLYLRPAPGYLFIPLIVDLLYKQGVAKKSLLSEEFVGAMEQVGHIAALEEIKKISAEEAVQKCAEDASKNLKNPEWLTTVMNYFKGEKGNLLKALSTPFKALHRGDIFLFSLSSISFSNLLFDPIAQQWFALISTLLLIDDMDDLESDLQTGEENAFIQSGLNAEGLEQIIQLVNKNVSTISTLNVVMANKIESQFIEFLERPDVLHQLNLTV